MATKSIEAKAFRLIKGGVMYIHAAKDDLPKGSTHWQSSGRNDRLVCETRLAFEQELWAREVPVLNEVHPITGMTTDGAYVTIEIDEQTGALRGATPRYTKFQTLMW